MSRIHRYNNNPHEGFLTDEPWVMSEEVYNQETLGIEWIDFMAPMRDNNDDEELLFPPQILEVFGVAYDLANEYNVSLSTAKDIVWWAEAELMHIRQKTIKLRYSDRGPCHSFQLFDTTWKHHYTKQSLRSTVGISYQDYTLVRLFMKVDEPLQTLQYYVKNYAAARFRTGYIPYPLNTTACQYYKDQQWLTKQTAEHMRNRGLRRMTFDFAQATGKPQIMNSADQFRDLSDDGDRYDFLLGLLLYLHDNHGFRHKFPTWKERLEAYKKGQSDAGDGIIKIGEVPEKDEDIQNSEMGARRLKLGEIPRNFVPGDRKPAPMWYAPVDGKVCGVKRANPMAGSMTEGEADGSPDTKRQHVEE